VATSHENYLIWMGSSWWFLWEFIGFLCWCSRLLWWCSWILRHVFLWFNGNIMRFDDIWWIQSDLPSPNQHRWRVCGLMREKWKLNEIYLEWSDWSNSQDCNSTQHTFLPPESNT
jgi:hypothetical protein